MAGLGSKRKKSRNPAKTSGGSHRNAGTGQETGVEIKFEQDNCHISESEK
jgi:hypothetical protein